MRLVLPFASGLAADQAEPVESELGARAVPVRGLKASAALAVGVALAQIGWAEPGLDLLEEADWEADQVSVGPPVEAAEGAVAAVARSVAVVAVAGSATVDWAEPGPDLLEEADWETVQVSVVVPVESAADSAAPLARSAAIVAVAGSAPVD
jgi:hypothetical protein